MNPSFPERIFIMAEKEQNSALLLQKATIDLHEFQIKQQAIATQRGQYLGTIIAFGFLSGAVYLAVNGHDYVAATLVGVTLLGIIAL